MLRTLTFLFTSLLLTTASSLVGGISDQMTYEVGRPYKQTAVMNVSIGSITVQHIQEHYYTVNGETLNGGEITIDLTGELSTARTRLKMKVMGIAMDGPWATATGEQIPLPASIRPNGRCSFHDKSVEFPQTVQGRPIKEIVDETLKAQEKILWVAMEKGGDAPCDPYVENPDLDYPLSLNCETENKNGKVFVTRTGSLQPETMKIKEWRYVLQQVGSDGEAILAGIVKAAEQQGIKLTENSMVFMQGDLTQEGTWLVDDHFVYAQTLVGTLTVRNGKKEMVLKVDLKLASEKA